MALRRGPALAGAVAGALVAAVSASPASAQVNTEPFRARIKDRGYSFILQGTFDGHTGNTFGVTADGLVGVGVARGPHLAFAFLSGDYAKLNGTLGVAKSFAHARYVYELTRFAWWEVFAQAQSDVFQRIETRNLFGTGPRVAVFERREAALFVGVAYMFERDVIDVAPGATEQRIPLENRLSAYFTAHATLRDGIDTVTTTYVQPRLDDASDIRILSESGFVFKVNTRLSTNITFSAHYDSNPPASVLPTDVELKNAITFIL
jgi:hypothetical protein